MIKFEVIVVHIIIAALQDSVTSNDQCCNGVRNSVPANIDISTYQQLGVCQFGCIPDQEELLLLKLSQGNSTEPHSNVSCCDTGTRQLQVGVCINNTWEMALCNTSTYAYYYLTNDQCTPGKLSASQNMTDPHSITLNWTQPLHSYNISCCPALHNETDCTDKHPIQYYYESPAQSAVITGLTPYTLYECCVWAVHNDWKGEPSCKCVQTAEAAPGPPTDFNVYHVMTNRFLLTWKPPSVNRNGVIRSYRVEITEKKGEVVFNDTTEGADPFFLTDEGLLRGGRTYTFRVAAYTNNLGSFSNATDFLLPQERIMIQLILGIAIGVLILILTTVTIVAVTVCNRMRKQNKSLTREIQEYELTSKYSAVRHDTGSLPERYSAIKKHDSNRKQPLYPPAHLAADYLTPTVTKTAGTPVTEQEEKRNEEEVNTDDKSKDSDSEHIIKEKTKTKETHDVKDSDENPYQALIVTRADATTVSIDGYIKIVRSRVGSVEQHETSASKPPSVPPKPEPDYSLKSSIPQLSLASDQPLMGEIMCANRSGTL